MSDPAHIVNASVHLHLNLACGCVEKLMLESEPVAGGSLYRLQT